MFKKIIVVIVCTLFLSINCMAADNCETSYTDDIFNMIGDIVTAPCSLLATCLGLVGEAVPCGPPYEYYVIEEVIEEEVWPPKESGTPSIQAEPESKPEPRPTETPQRSLPKPEEEIVVPTPPRPEAPKPQTIIPEAPKSPEIKEKTPYKPKKPCAPRKAPCGPVYPYYKGGEYWFLFQ